MIRPRFFALSLVLSCALGTTATEYHWNNRTSGNLWWSDSRNWVDADGNPVDSYPGQNSSSDIAVFDGMGRAGRAYINVDLDLACLRFADGNSTLRHERTNHFHADRLEMSPHATFGYMAEDWGGFSQPNDFTIGNRNEVLYNGNGMIRGSINYQNQSGGNWSSRRVLSLDENGNLLTGQGTTRNDYNVWGDGTFDDPLGFLFGDWGSTVSFRGVHFGNAGTWTLTVPYPALIHESQWGSIGRYIDQGQGTIKTLGESVYYWPSYIESNAQTNYFRAKIDAPTFLQCGFGCTVMYDDHTSDTCSYDITAGILQLGGEILVENVSRVENTTCQLGPGPIDIRWSGKLRIACDNPLNHDTILRFHSFRERGADRKVTDALYGKMELDGFDAEVRFLELDGFGMRNGTYGSSESDAEFKRDDLFEGTGVLTVRAWAHAWTGIFVR